MMTKHNWKGSWRPDAFIMLTKSLRTSGFLWALPPEDLKTFLLLLAFITPEGRCAVDVLPMASALHLSPSKAQVQLERLRALRWKGQPVVLSHHADSGLEIFGLAPGFLPVNEEETKPKALEVLKTVPRDIVIEYSRRRYGRPRAEVERQIAELNNWDLPQETAATLETLHWKPFNRRTLLWQTPSEPSCEGNCCALVFCRNKPTNSWLSSIWCAFNVN